MPADIPIKWTVAGKWTQFGTNQGILDIHGIQHQRERAIFYLGAQSMMGIIVESSSECEQEQVTAVIDAAIKEMGAFFKVFAAESGMSPGTIAFLSAQKPQGPLS